MKIKVQQLTRILTESTAHPPLHAFCLDTFAQKIIVCICAARCKAPQTNSNQNAETRRGSGSKLNKGCVPIRVRGSCIDAGVPRVGRRDDG